LKLARFASVHHRVPFMKITCRHVTLAAAAAFAAIITACGGSSGVPGAGSGPPWTWVSGGNTGGASGNYGTLGASAASNVPGAREAPVTWTDSSGNLWLFGGLGYDSAGTGGYLNDLWKYTPGTGWIWVSGSDKADAIGVYGTQGKPLGTTVPGGRESAVSWIDASGELWLFGGVGFDSVGTAVGSLNDLWKFSPATGQWTWVSGSATVATATNAIGVYGTKGVAAATNTPGARESATAWIDAKGNLWLFGGLAYDSTGNQAAINDLWEYTPSTGQWTWVSGSNTGGAIGVYGNQDTAAAGNAPGARTAPIAWTDASGNLGMFGGYGLDSTGSSQGYLNDLWKFEPGTGWAWIGGSPTSNALGVYGTQGTGASGNGPGARAAAVASIDSSGNLWLFGGEGLDATGTLGVGYLNDLWEFTPSSGTWTWVSGSATVNAAGAYGTQGTGAVSNVPGGRYSAAVWTDSSGTMWLFGGNGLDVNDNYGDLNDLWKVTP